MGYVTGDRVLETTVAPGTGNVSLAGAVTNYRTFASVATANGDMFPYVIASSTDWEVGIGTRLTSTTFSRSVIASSNSNALVNFSGTCEVWIDWINTAIETVGSKDLCINGGMSVDQVLVNTALTGRTAFAYGADQWLTDASSDAVYSIQTDPNGPPGFAHCYKTTITTADASLAATQYFKAALTYLEGLRCWEVLKWGTGDGKPLSVGFWVRANRTGTYCAYVTNAAKNRSWVHEFTINSATTWEYKSFVAQGDTSGTWPSNNGIGMEFGVVMAAGSNSFAAAPDAWVAGQFATSNQVNGIAATTDFMQVTGVSLVPGNMPITAEQSRYFVLPFNEQLSACQRYFEKSWQYAQVGCPTDYVGAITVKQTGLTSATNQMGWMIVYKVRKRATPGVTIYSASTATSGKVRDDTNSADVNPSTFNPGETGITVTATANAAVTGTQFSHQWVADARM
jgi:hypothetical protein